MPNVSMDNNLENVSQNLSSGMQSSAKNAISDFNTFHPAKVISYDAKNNTVEVEVQIKVRFLDNTEKTGGHNEDFGKLTKVPVAYFAASNCVVTCPPVKGDECSIYFSQKSMGMFIETGTLGNPMHYQNGATDDAVAIFNRISHPASKAIKNIKEGVYQIRKVDSNDSYIEYDQAKDTTMIKASDSTSAVVKPGNVTITVGSTTIVVTDGDVTVTTSSATIDAPNTHITGDVKVDGNVDISGGVKVGKSADVTANVTAANFSGPQGAAMSSTSNIKTTKDVKAGGISLSGHTHSFNTSDGASGTTKPPG